MSSAPPGMMGAFPQFAPMPGALGTFPLVGYQGSTGVESPPRVETPEEMTARLAEEERDRLRSAQGGDATEGGPNGPSLGDPFDGSRSAFGISNYSGVLGNVGSLVGMGTGVPGVGAVAGTIGAAVDASKANPSLGVIGVEPIGVMGMLEAGVFGGLLGGRNIEAQYLDAIAAKEPQVAAMMSMYGLAPTPEQLAAMQTNPTPSVTAPTAPTMEVDVTTPGFMEGLDAALSGPTVDSFGPSGPPGGVVEGSPVGMDDAPGTTADDEEGGGGGPAGGGPADGGATGGSNSSTGDSDQGGVSDAAADASYRVGGQIPADGDGALEAKPITAHEGEFVLTPEAVQMLGGPEKLAAINEAAMSGGMIQSDEGMPLTRNPMPDPMAGQDIAPRLRGGSILMNGGETESEPLNLNDLALQSAMLGGRQKPQRPAMMGA